jgi:hypothetical protein
MPEAPRRSRASSSRVLAPTLRLIRLPALRGVGDRSARPDAMRAQI